MPAQLLLQGGVKVPQGAGGWGAVGGAPYIRTKPASENCTLHTSLLCQGDLDAGRDGGERVQPPACPGLVLAPACV